MTTPAGYPPEQTEHARPRGRDVPAAVQESMTLANGASPVVRSVDPSDADALAAGYQQLSATSAYQRFFTMQPELSARQVRYFAAVDHRDHDAVGAVSEDSGDGVGIARYIRDDSTDPSRAELAIVVVDVWQRLGVGYELLRVLCDRAREEGISVLRAEFLSENSALPALLRRFGRVQVQTSGTTSTATLDIG